MTNFTNYPNLTRAILWIAENGFSGHGYAEITDAESIAIFAVAKKKELRATEAFLSGLSQDQLEVVCWGNNEFNDNVTDKEFKKLAKRKAFKKSGKLLDKFHSILAGKETECVEQQKTSGLAATIS